MPLTHHLTWTPAIALTKGRHSSAPLVHAPMAGDNNIRISVSSEEGTVQDLTPSQMSQSALRKRIHEIQRDSALTPQEKAKRMQELMMSGSVAKKTGSSTSLSSEVLSVEEKDREASLTPDGDLGCKHYKRGCKLLAECCRHWYPCRHCHNEEEDHEMDRFATQYMLCMHCHTPQRTAQECKECGKSMAGYFCQVCKLWSDDPSKSIFHCEGCKLCRKGRQQDFKHCNRCNSCMSLSHFGKHTCIERSLESDCPICGEFMFTSTRDIVYLDRCGHPIHRDCQVEHIKAGLYQCPICLKSMIDTTMLFSQIESMLEMEEMPDEYAGMRSHIYCNDCEQKSWTPFHFIYHRCQECNSFNTKVLRTVNSEEEEESSSSIAEGESQLSEASAIPHSDTAEEVPLVEDNRLPGNVPVQQG